jgi:hypothetical protein
MRKPKPTSPTIIQMMNYEKILLLHSVNEAGEECALVFPVGVQMGVTCSDLLQAGT